MEEELQTSDQIAAGLRALINYERSQRDLAKTLGVSSAYLSEVLAGRKKIGTAILTRLGYDTEPLYRKLPPKGTDAQD